MARKPGTSNRSHPEYSLAQALAIPRAIQDGASGMPVSRLTLSELTGRSPNASQFRQLLLASRAYGLTVGGVNAEQFELTPLGNEATGADEVAQAAARRKAVMNIEPYRVFLTAHNGKRFHLPPPSVSFSSDRRARIAEAMTASSTSCDARAVGFIRKLSSGEYVDLEGVESPRLPGEDQTSPAEKRAWLPPPIHTEAGWRLRGATDSPAMA
jgi:hypothetical protein